MRIALVCPTIGQTRRGYERYFSDLFRFTSGKTDIVLFKGGGQELGRERVVPHLSRSGILAALFRDSFRYQRFRLEFASFAASVWPRVAFGHFELIHFIDPPLGPHFARLRRLTRTKAALLFSNAGAISFDASRWADHIHCLTPQALAEAEHLGMDKRRLSMVPMGVDPKALSAFAPRAAVREKFGIQQDRFVVLAIASINRHHKRVDYLIEEIARLPKEPMLWLDGSLHPDGDPSLLELGRMRLGERFRHSHLPSERVADLYAMADVFVSAALQESFGMAISEAMTANLPVITHDSEHFRWLVGEQGHYVDMTTAGTLAAKLQELMRDPVQLRSVVDPCAVIARFGWSKIGDQHLKMYATAIAAGATVKR